MTKKEYLIVAFFGLSSFFSWLIFFVIFFEVAYTPDVYIIIWNLYNRLNVYYIFTLSLIMFLLTIIGLYYIWHWAGIEKELKEEIKYCGVHTLRELKRYKKEKVLLN